MAVASAAGLWIPIDQCVFPVSCASVYWVALIIPTWRFIVGFGLPDYGVRGREEFLCWFSLHDTPKFFFRCMALHALLTWEAI